MNPNKFDALFDLIESEMKKRERTVLAIDGAAASGKTTLAELLKEKYNAAVVHMDDFFLPKDRKTAERLAECDGNIDRERFIAEILPNIGKKSTFEYGKYDCSKGVVTHNVSVEATSLVVVEGVYSMSAYFRDSYDIKVMLTVDSDTQTERLRKRCSPERFDAFINVWLPLEKKYFELGGVSEACDMII